MSIAQLLIILALVCEIVAACGVAVRVNLVALGLAFYFASLLIH